jgi:hypothetical protein
MIIVTRKIPPTPDFFFTKRGHLVVSQRNITQGRRKKEEIIKSRVGAIKKILTSAGTVLILFSVNFPRELSDLNLLFWFKFEEMLTTS